MCLLHLEFELQLGHDRHQQQRVDGEELLDEIKHVLREVAHRGLPHHQHLIKELDTGGGEQSQGQRRVRKVTVLNII